MPTKVAKKSTKPAKKPKIKKSLPLIFGGKRLKHDYSQTPDPENVGSWTRAERVIGFIEHYCVVPEGKLVGQPFVLDPFQKEFIYDVYDNSVDTTLAILSIARKNGKALPLDMPIPTPCGFTTMGELKVGDYVIGADGLPTRVRLKSHVHYKPCYKITWDDGTQTVCCEDHLWRVRIGGMARKWKNKTANELYEIFVTTGQSVAISLTRPVAHSEKTLPIDPYLLGYWLGDGKSNVATIYCGKQDLAHIKQQLDAVGEPYTVKRDSGGKGLNGMAYEIRLTDGVRNRADKSKFQSRLKALGLLNNKHIPDVYLTASTEQRWSLLQGLMDSDGSCELGNGSPRCYFSQKDEVLPEQVQQLAQSLGLKASCREKHETYGGEKYVSYLTVFNAYDDQPVFRLARKQSRLQTRPEKPTRASFRYVADIEPIAAVPTQCIQVENEDSLFLCGQNYVVTHNTGLIAALLLCHICGPEAVINSQVVSGAMSRDQAALVFKLACKMINFNAELEAETHIIPSKKQIIGLAMNVEYQALSADARVSHGLSPVLAILDEVGQVRGPKSDFIDAITTAGGAYDNPLIIGISTQAPSDADLLSLWIDDALRGDDPHLVCHLYTSSKEKPITDIDEIRAANPALGTFKSEVQALRSIHRSARIPSEENKSRNLDLNQRVSLETLYIGVSIWRENDGVPSLDVLRNASVVAMGLDLSARHDLTAAVVAAADEDGNVHLLTYTFCPAEGIEERADRDKAPYDQWVTDGYLIPVGGKSIDYDDVVNYLKEDLAEKGIEVTHVRFDKWRMDVFKKACENCEAFEWAEFESVGQGYRDQSPSLEAFTSLLLDGQVFHGNHPLLNMAAANAIAVPDPTGSIKLDKRKSTQRIDPIMAAHQAAFRVSEGNLDEGFNAAAMIG